MISLWNADTRKKEGRFQSYKGIGDYLTTHGETATYYAIPSGIKSIAAMKEIKVRKYADEGDIEIIMDGSYY